MGVAHQARLVYIQPYARRGSFAMPANDLTCTATFTLDSYALTVTKAGNGSGTVGGGGTYAVGAPVTLTATADAGSTFTGWSPSPCAAGFAMPASNLTCTATFALNTYALTLAKTGTGSGTVSGGGPYATGAPVALTATADAGSAFTIWSPNPCANSFAMPASDLTCTVTFTRNYGALTLVSTTLGYALQTGTGTLLQITYNGQYASAGNPGGGWSAIGAAAAGTGYTLYWKNTNGTYAQWNLDGTGALTGGRALSGAEMDAAEDALGTDLTGDGA